MKQIITGLPQNPIEQPKTLKELSDELFAVDLRIKELSRSSQKFYGEDVKVNASMPDYISNTTVDDVLNAMTPNSEIDKLNQQAKSIIEKMLVIDPTVRLDCFNEYGY